MHDLQSFNRMEPELFSHTSGAVKFLNVTTTDTSAHNEFGNVNFVEWYWVTLGLVVPVLCGAMFCLLDYFRQKRRKRFRSAARIESMCERNKYSPPQYNEVVPGQIIIEPIIPVYHSTVAQIDESQTTDRSPKLETNANQTSSTPKQSRPNPHNNVPSSSHQDDQVAGPSLAAQPVPSTSPTRVIQPDAVSIISEDIPEEAPPSYDDHHLYDIYGSRAHLV